jgi:hypothetical protein
MLDFSERGLLYSRQPVGSDARGGMADMQAYAYFYFRRGMKELR